MKIVSEIKPSLIKDEAVKEEKEQRKSAHKSLEDLAGCKRIF